MPVWSFENQLYNTMFTYSPSMYTTEIDFILYYKYRFCFFGFFFLLVKYRRLGVKPIFLKKKKLGKNCIYAWE